MLRVRTRPMPWHGRCFARVRLLPVPSYASRVALAISAAGWPSAFYGALIIWAAGNFDQTGSAWIFGWPFVTLLGVATCLGVLAWGLDGSARRAFLMPGAAAINRALAPSGTVRPVAAVELREAIDALGRLPTRNAWYVVGASLMVVVGCVLLERAAAGPGSPNFAVIVRSGLVAVLLYTASSVTLAELLVRPGCRALRRAALDAGLRLSDEGTIARRWRLFAAVTPPLTALAAAVELTYAAQTSPLAYVALIALAATVAVATAALQYESHERGVRDVVVACRELGSGDGAQLVTGAIDVSLVALAHEFNAASRRVDADRRLSSDRYRALFEGAGDAILLIDPPTGRVVEVSARAERLFGRSRRELVGRTFASLVDPATATRLHELGLDRPVRSEVSLVNIFVTQGDGTPVPVDASLTVVCVGDQWVLQAIVRDVSDRRRIEEQLRRAAQRFEELYRLAVGLVDDASALAEHGTRALAELLPCPIAGVFRLDGDGVTALAVIRDGTLEDHGAFALAGPCVEVVRARRACLVTDVPARFPGDAMVAAGIQTYLGVPIFDGRGAVVGVVVVFERRVREFGAEEQRLLESFASRIGLALERERLTGERDALTVRLVESDRVKSEFLGMMSHELRTPLNVVLGYTRLLLEDIDDGGVASMAERREILERMLGGSLHLHDLVEDTLSVLRLEAGVVQMDAAPLELPGFFVDLQNADRLLSRSLDVVERWVVDDDVPLLVTDRRKLRQVIGNLVGNARKFTERGLIEVHASRDPATGGAAITVRDTGCGIGLDDLPHVFDLYRQAATRRRADGCGLGLYIVRRYVELLGGYVACTSIVGQGTTFTVSLPVGGGAGRVAAAAAA